jgi:hypothetical protein
MFTHTFHTGRSPQVRLAECKGRLTIESWAERDIAIEAQAEPEHAEQEGETLVIQHGQGDMLLRVPADTTITIVEHKGDVAARGIQALAIEHTEGSVRAERISGAVRLRDIYGQTGVDGVAALTIERDTRPYDERLWKHLRRHIEIANTGTIEIAEASDNLTIVAARQVAAGPVGGNATVREVAGELRLGAIGGNCAVAQVAGNLRVGPVGGNAEILATGDVLEVGNIGGNLMLDAAPLTVADRAQIIVGGNARLVLPDDADLSIHAIIGGVVYGAGISSIAIGMATISYGAGTARLSLTVGGNLELQGGAPQISSMLGGIRARPGKLKTKPDAMRERAPRPSSAQAQGDEATRSTILRMVATGDISAEEAERQLDALDRK